MHEASGVEDTKSISPNPLFLPSFSLSSQYWLPIEYHIYIWQVSPQMRWHFSNMNLFQIIGQVLSDDRKCPQRKELMDGALVTPIPVLLGDFDQGEYVTSILKLSPYMDAAVILRSVAAVAEKMAWIGIYVYIKIWDVTSMPYR